MSSVIRISDATYKRLESLATGFDTPAGVIERLLDAYEGPREEYNLAKATSERIGTPQKQRGGYNLVASGKFTKTIEKGRYTMTSPKGVSKTFALPDPKDKQGIKELTYEVERFMKEQGGTIGQINSARKKLTDNGYHITR